MTTRCLMIKTKDKRKFFTHEKNLPQLIEFSKTFDAEMSIVKLVQDQPILELRQLAPALCNGKNNNVNDDSYEVVAVLLPKPLGNNRKTIITKAANIKKYILDQFMAGNVVSLKDLRNKAQESLSESALCNHISRVRQELVKNGLKIKKVGAGEYKLDR